MQKLFEFDIHIGAWKVLVQSRDIANKAITRNKIGDHAVGTDQIDEGAVSWECLDENTQHIIATGAGQHGIPLSNEFGESEIIGMTQKKLTEEILPLKELPEEVDSLKGRVRNAEQDINGLERAISTSNDFTIRDGRLARKNKAYNPAQYSGLGELYLEKNNTFLGREFDEFVVNVDVSDPTAIAETFDGLVYDRHRKEFLVYELVDGERVYYAEWIKFDKWESTDDYVPEAGYDFICEADDKAYRWTEETTPDLIETEAHYGNVLKQEMVNLSNTIYHIQYDYDLIGKEITIPEGCVLQFEGGSLKNGTIVGDNTKINVGIIKIFNADIVISGSWDVAESYPEWFGAIGDGIVDDTESISKTVTSFKKAAFTKVYRICSFLEIPKTCICTFNRGYFKVDTFDTETQTGGWVYFNNPIYPIKPEWFGAKADNSTDDTKAIQNAIDSNLNPNVFPIGKTQAEAGRQHTSYNKLSVELSGNYLISSALNIRAEQHFNALTIYSETKSLIRGGGNTSHTDTGILIAKPDDYPQGDQDTQTLKTIKGIWFTYFDTAIYNGGTDWDSSISYNFFQDIYIAAIYAANCNGTLIENNYGCWVYGYLVDLYYSSSCRIINNFSGETDAQGAKGIRIRQGINSGNIVANNTLHNCGITVSDRKGYENKGSCDLIKGNNIIRASVAILTQDSCIGILIDGNSIYNCTKGISSFTSINIRNNLFVNCITGIELRQTGGNISISGCTFKNCDNGIEWNYAQYHSLVGCNFYSCTKAIKAGNNGNKGFIADNQFIDCTTVHDFTQTSPETAAQFAYNYSSQNGLVLGRELN